MNEHLARWTLISIIKYFEAISTGISLPFFVEGIDERDEDNQRENHAELRVNGPDVSLPSSNWWSVEVAINILLTEQMLLSGSDSYNIVRWCGAFQNAMQSPISVKKYGNGVDDDQSLIGCLKVRNREPKAIMVWHFGQIDKDNRIRQSEVDALFDLDIS
jgi:hypothetical protein